MDCLTGYGSDSEESSPSSTAAANNKEVSGGDCNQGAKAAPLSSLLGAGIDSCSSSSDEDEAIHKHKLVSRASSSTSNHAPDNVQEQATKKQRTETNEKKKRSLLARNGLPSPQPVPASAAQSPSMISWTKDYVSQEQYRSPVATSSTDRRQFSKFEKLAASRSYDSKAGWAVHLRNQNEFHNPNFLQSVIEKFDIRESLGSQAVRRKKCEPGFEC